MRLSRISGTEPTAKQSFSFKTSTVAALTRYQECYVATHGADVPLKDMVEKMLQQFMLDDKDFQRFLKKEQSVGMFSSGENSMARHCNPDF